MWTLVFWVSVGVVLASYVGYPAWVMLLARIRPRPSLAEYLPDDELPSVTCVMAAADEGASIERKLKILEAQDYPAAKVSIIVVSDASTDDTDNIVSSWAERNPRISLLRTPRRSGKPTALNLARTKLTGDVTILMDVRQELTPTALRDLVAHLQDPSVGLVSGDLRVRGDSYWTYEGMIRKAESRSGSMAQVTGSLYAIRTPDFPEIPTDVILDDVYVPLTLALAGKRIVMAEKAGSLDVVTRSTTSELSRKVRTLAGLVQICHKVRGSLNPVRNPIWGRFVMHKLARLACPYAIIAAVLSSVLIPAWPYRLAFAGAIALLLLAAAAQLGSRFRPATLTRSFLALNLAALIAPPAFYLGRAKVTWARVESDRS